MNAWPALMVLLLAALPARALVLGGGVADKDCRLAFDGVDATSEASGVVCLDGDPACDADAEANGACRFAVRICVGVTLEACTPVQIDRIEVGGEPLAAPPVPATAGACGETSTIDVAAGGPAAATTLRGYRSGELGEVDYLNLCCLAQAGPLAAAACSVGFDPAASACVDLPGRASRKVERARELIGRAIGEPAATTLLHKAGKQMRRLRKLGQKVARRSDCGYALGLMATHAADVIDATAESAAP